MLQECIIFATGNFMYVEYVYFGGNVSLDTKHSQIQMREDNTVCVSYMVATLQPLFVQFVVCISKGTQAGGGAGNCVCAYK